MRIGRRPEPDRERSCRPELPVDRQADDPPAPKATAGGGLSAAAATAFNQLFAAQVKEIGLGRALVTSINRAQGAYAKKQTAWETKQMRAAGPYAAQLAAALLDDARDRPELSRALSGPEVADAAVSDEDVYAIRDKLIAEGLPGRTVSTLSKLGFSKAEQQLIYGWRLAADASRLSGNLRAKIADPKLLEKLRGMAAKLKAFSKKAARDPLHTGT